MNPELAELYDLELYPDWKRFEREHFADGARKRTEVIWLNHAANGQLPWKSLELEVP